MIPRITSMKTLENYKLLVVFDVGKTVLYDVEDIRIIPQFHPLKSVSDLFQSAQLDSSRICIYWNEQIDLPSDAIWEYGTEVSG